MILRALRPVNATLALMMHIDRQVTRKGRHKAMRKLGTIREIWRYPVKGMAGERVETCSLDDMGLNGDRRWAVRDLGRDEIQSCKFRPQLLRCTARTATDSEGPLIEFPDGETVTCDDAGINDRLSDLLGHASRIEVLNSNQGMDRFRRYKSSAVDWLDELKATFDRVEGEPLPDFSNLPQSVADFVSVPGTFFLVAPVHIITTATLGHLANAQRSAVWDPRRFRPNLVIETQPGEQGLAEQSWIGQTLDMGGAKLACTATTPRCGAITRAQRDFGADTQVLRTVVKHAEQNLGIYGRAAEPGILNAGDEVWIS